VTPLPQRSSYAAPGGASLTGSQQRRVRTGLDELLRRSDELRERSTYLNDQIAHFSARMNFLCAQVVRDGLLTRERIQ
jgi:hypothetical protein